MIELVIGGLALLFIGITFVVYDQSKRLRDLSEELTNLHNTSELLTDHLHITDKILEKVAGEVDTLRRKPLKKPCCGGCGSQK